MKPCRDVISFLFYRKITDCLTFFLVAALILPVIITGCEKDQIDTFNEEDLNTFLYSLPPISDAMEPEKPTELDNSDTVKTLEYITITDYYSAAAGYDEQIVLSPQTDVIYPGALVKGETILDGTYVPIPAVRKSITISTSLTGEGDVSTVIEDPKLSSVREAINGLMNQDYDVPPANLSFTTDQVYSEDQLNLSLHASYKTKRYDISGSFDYSNKEIKTRMVAKFIQSYYTLDMDLPSKPSDLFKEDVDQALFGTYMPMYVSSVTYGRMALFTIESTLDKSEVETALNASYSKVKVDGEADFAKLDSTSTIKVFVLGGSGSSAAATIEGFDAFKSYVIDGGNFSKDSPGSPISYKLRYIRDNSIGRIVFAASYPIVTSIPRDDNIVYDISTYLYSLHAYQDESECELYGNIKSWPESNEGSTKFTHFSRGDDNCLLPGYDDIYNFADNTDTNKEWLELKQNDAIMIYFELSEDDNQIIKDPDIHFEKSTFRIPISEILLGIDQSRPYYEKTDLIVRSGINHVDVSFRFTPSSKHIDLDL